MERNATYASAVDELTVRRAQNGDMGAMASIYEAYAKPSYNLALRIAGSAAIAEDIVHDSFIKVMAKIGSYRGDASLWSWIRRITVNTAINDLNRRKWLKPMDEADPLGQESLPGQFDRGTAAATEHDLEVLLGRLPQQARTVLLLHDAEGMTHQEIAEIFGRTESFSKSILFRARKQLAAMIAQDTEPEND